MQLLLALSEDHCVFSENSRLACARACARVHARMHAAKSADGAAPVATGVVPMHGNSTTADLDSTPSLKFEDIIGLPTPLKHRFFLFLDRSCQACMVRNPHVCHAWHACPTENLKGDPFFPHFSCQFPIFLNLQSLASRLRPHACIQVAEAAKDPSNS